MTANLFEFMRHSQTLSSLLIIGFLYYSCEQVVTSKESDSLPAKEVGKPAKKLALSSDFKSYWYNGEAEISSFKLEQERYGELRSGEAVLIYVTEDFLPNKQVKADVPNENTVPIIKLNATKKFQTGIYPYSIMQSAFYPLTEDSHVLKESASIQEWCGQVYIQLNNKEHFEITSHSYFESEADESFHLEKNFTENELWIKLRIDPKSLPVGTIKIIPSLEFSRLRHVPLRVFEAQAVLKNDQYTLNYPALNRKLSISFNPSFPHEIIGWEETITKVNNENSKPLITRATLLKTIKLDYWTKNGNDDVSYLDTLKLRND